MRQPWPVRFVVFSCVAALLVSGCGGRKGVEVSGQVLLNGAPIKLLPSEEIMVGFSEEAPAGQQPIAAWAPINASDGAFTLAGPAGKGIPAGRYRVVVSSQPYQKSEDRFEAVFDEKLPPLIAEVGTEQGQTFVIDVRTRTVTKK
jgi:hypothetical protein